MYLYYQNNAGKDENGNGESWKSVKDTPQARETLAKKQVDMVAMLAISTTDPDADYERLNYRGDLYFDIDTDADTDLSVSITSVKTLVKKLREKGVHEVQVYLSGKKGFHVIVPSETFNLSTSSGIKWLPYIYGEMAESYFSVEGLDMSVYSGGKGRLWRQANVKRKDNGKYKVPIHVNDLYELTVERYQELCSQPNHELLSQFQKRDKKSIELSLEMSEIFEHCAITVRKAQESKEVYRYEANPSLEMLSEVPGCIKKLVAGEDVKANANFNKAAMALAGYLKSANKLGSDLQDELMAEMVAHNNFNSASYKSERARLVHLKSAMKRAPRDRHMGANPAFVLSNVDKCGNCVICNGTLNKKKETEAAHKQADDGIRHNVFESSYSYLKEYGPKHTKPLTTFTIEPKSADIIYNKELRCFRREGLNCEVTYASNAEGKEGRTSVYIDEAAWDSVSLFKKQFQGIDNLAITATEDDLADLRHYVMTKHSDIDTAIKSYTLGLDVKEIPHGEKLRKVLVYSEPNYTAAGNNVRVPVKFSDESHGTIAGVPQIHKAPDLTSDDSEVAKAIFNINEAWVCATMIGWVAATSLKPHIHTVTNEFPLLGVAGRPGTGKTTLACIMTDLAGCTYDLTGEPMSAMSTAAGIERYLASSTSTPRVLDECNAKAHKSNVKLLDTMKACYNSLEIVKGTAAQSTGASGLTMRSIRMTAPLMYLSEQPQIDDALKHRSIEIMLTMNAHGTDQRGRLISASELPAETIKQIKCFNFIDDYENRAKLRGIGKAIIHQSLCTPVTWVREKMTEYKKQIAEARIYGRQKLGWSVILMGLDMYELALREQCDINVSAEIKNAKAMLINRIMDKTVNDNVVDNCNTEVLNFLAIMAEKSAIAEIRDDRARITVDRMSDYRRTDDKLMINLRMVWPELAKTARASSSFLKYNKADQFLSALKTEPYFVESRGVWVILDIEKLKEAEVYVDHFYNEELIETKREKIDGIF